VSQEMAFSPLGAIFELGQTETNGLTSRTTALLSKAEVARNRGKSAKGGKAQAEQVPPADPESGPPNLRAKGRWLNRAENKNRQLCNQLHNKPSCLVTITLVYRSWRM